MPRHLAQSDLENLMQIIKQSANGASIEDIIKGWKGSIPRRTVQRWLATLVQDGGLVTEGQARARRYRIAESKGVAQEVLPPFDKEVAQQEIIPFTPEAKSIHRLISQPLQLRRHVSYNREFLDDYQPNYTFYLPPSLRQHLLNIGKSPDGKRPAGTYARQILSRLLIDLSWNSSRLEGNTYSLLETERLLEQGILSEGKDVKETQMILNHKSAIEFIVESVEDIGINRYTVFNLHALLSFNLLGNPRACGSIRTIPVGIAKTVYHPLAVPQLINECFQQILDKASAIENPFEQSFFLMIHLPYLQPFEDVNKRVSRLAANLPMIRENLCPLSFVDVPEHDYINGLLGVYELNRIELIRDVFAWAYERSSLLYSATRKTLGEPDSFRLQYHQWIKETLHEIVSSRMSKLDAIANIRRSARERIPLDDQARFIEVVEVEIMSLHEGNIACYRIPRKEFQAWREIWN